MLVKTREGDVRIGTPQVQLQDYALVYPSLTPHKGRKQDIHTQSTNSHQWIPACMIPITHVHLICVTHASVTEEEYTYNRPQVPVFKRHNYLNATQCTIDKDVAKALFSCFVSLLVFYDAIVSKLK